MFEPAATDEFTLNQHEHRRSNRRGVLVDPHELIVNREVGHHLKLDKVKIRIFNETTLNSKLELLGNALLSYGRNITLKEVGSFSLMTTLRE